MTKSMLTFLGFERIKLRKLLKSVSADQAEIFLKNVHPEVWEKLKGMAAQDTVEPRVVYQNPSRLMTAFKFASGIVVGAVIYANSDEYIRQHQEEISHYKAETKNWIVEKSKIVAEGARQGYGVAVIFSKRAVKVLHDKYIEEMRGTETPERELDADLDKKEKSIRYEYVAKKEEFGRISRSDVNLRTFPSHKSKSQVVMKQGGCVTVLGREEGNWVHVSVETSAGETYEGYMAGSRLSPISGYVPGCLVELKR